MRYIPLLSAFLLVGCASIDPNPISTCRLERASSESIQEFTGKDWLEKKSLKGGLSDSTLLRVSDGKISCVLRTINHRNREDKLRELQAQIIASHQGYGPHLYAYDLEQGLMYMSVLDKCPETMAPSIKAQKLAELLKDIHEGPAYCASKPIVSLIRKKFDGLKDFPKDIDIKRLTKMLYELNVLEPYPLKPTHRDLNPNNITQAIK